MSKQELVRLTREALAEFAALPHEEQIRQMTERGIINHKGEVMFGEDAPKPQQTRPNVDLQKTTDN